MDLPVTKGSVHSGLCQEESFVQRHSSSLKSPADATNKMNPTWQKSPHCKELIALCKVRSLNLKNKFDSTAICNSNNASKHLTQTITNN